MKIITKDTILLIICSLTITLFFSCEKEKSKTPEPVKQQCEISNTGTIKIVNKTSYAITVKIDGSTPSNMGYMGPDVEASIEVTAGSNHSFHANTVSGSSSNLIWDKQISVGACKTDITNIIQ